MVKPPRQRAIKAYKHLRANQGTFHDVCKHLHPGILRNCSMLGDGFTWWEKLLFLESSKWGHSGNPTLVDQEELRGCGDHGKDQDKVSIKASTWYLSNLGPPVLVMVGEESRKSNIPPIYTLFMEFPVHSPHHRLLYAYSHEHSGIRA